MNKIFTWESDEQLLNLCEELGWEWPDDTGLDIHEQDYYDWIEQRAFDFLESRGYTIEI